MMLLLMMAVLLIGCSKPQTMEGKEIEILITRDFGKEKLDSKVLNFISETTVMDMMEDYFDIETAYGGSFVNSIGGLKSGFTDEKSKKKMDWFYYINGRFAEIGAADYDILPGDIIIWDYHDWSSEVRMTSIIGAYPNNFVNDLEGNRMPTIIQYALGYEDEAKKIADYLKAKGADISVSEGAAEGLGDEEGHTILIAPWDEIRRNEGVEDIYKNRNKTGLFFEIEEQVKVLDFNNQPVQRYEKAAVIASVSKGYGSDGSLWMITGNDEGCIKEGAKLLYEKPESLKGAFSLMLTNKEIINLPGQIR